MNFDFGLLGPIYLLTVAWPLTRIDLRDRRLPNRLTLPAFPITLCGQALAVWLGTEGWQFLVALLTAVVAFSASLALSRYAGLGMGDVKLITAIALALAWFNPFLPAIAFFIGIVLAGVVSLAMIFIRKASMGSSIALGPYLLVGFVLSLISQGWS